MSKTVLIAGYGNIGKLEWTFYSRSKKVQVYIYDKYKDEYNTPEIKEAKYDFCVICVDTPLNTQTLELDCSAVEDVLNTIDADIYISRSTLNPGTTVALMEKTGKRIVMYPEFYGTTQHANNFQFNFSILGGSSADTHKVAQLLQMYYDGRHTFRMVEPVVAELVKLAENTYLGGRVSFFGFFWLLCNYYKCSYDDFRECLGLDPRIGKEHSFIDDEHPDWDSHCLNKDIPATKAAASKAIPEAVNLVEALIAFNNFMKNYNKEGNK